MFKKSSNAFKIHLKIIDMKMTRSIYIYIYIYIYTYIYIYKTLNHSLEDSEGRISELKYIAIETICYTQRKTLKNKKKASAQYIWNQIS